VNDDRYISMRSFAKRLEVSSQKARRLASEAGLPMWNFGGEVRLREADVEAFIEGQRVSAVATTRATLKALVRAASERAWKRIEKRVP
jgi:excisionase family DNA binding protein